MVKIIKANLAPFVIVLVLIFLVSCVTTVVALDSTPTVTSASPASGTVLTVSNTQISFDVSDPDNITNSGYYIKLNGNTVSSTLTYTRGHWLYDSCNGDTWIIDGYDQARISANVSGLKDGIQTIQVLAKDNLGNEVTSSWTFTVAVKPTFSNMTPANGAVTNNNTTLSVTVQDNDSVDAGSIKLTVDGYQVTHNFNSSTGLVSYTADPPLTDGNHTIQIIAKDMAGNQNTATWAYTAVVSGPTLAFANSGTVFGSSSPLLSVSVNSPANLANDAVMKINGTTVPATFLYQGFYDSCTGFYTVTDYRKGTISFQTSSLADGQYTLDATAKDSYGNTTTQQWTFYVCTTPSVIQLSSATYSVSEGSNATITVTRTGGIWRTSKVNYATSNITAIAGQDYTASSGTVTFNPGEASKTFTVNIIDDTKYEAAETLNITISSPTGATLGAQKTGVLTINDNDPPPTIEFNSTVYSTVEGIAASMTVTRTGDTSVTSSVSYSTSNGTATSGSDYTAVSGTLTFTAGQTTKTFIVNTINDSFYEDDETVNLTLSSPTVAVLGTQSTAVLTITDNDPPPSVKFNLATYSVTEGGSATVTVTRTGDINTWSTVNYSTGNGTAEAADYTTSSGTLNFASGETTKTFTVSITNDSFYEGNETIILTLSSPVRAVLGTPNSAVLTIIDDDPPPVIEFESITYTAAEGETAIISVSRTGDTTITSTVNYTTSNGTATGADYISASGTLTFEPGDTNKSFTISITDDSLYEGNETVNLTLSDPTVAALGTKATAVLTITDNDPVPVIQFSSTTYTVDEGDTATVTVQLTGSSAVTSTVNYTVTNGSATDTSDYTAVSGVLTFNAGQTTKTFTVVTIDDSSYEGDETVTLTLSNPSNAALGTRSTAVLKIIENDSPPTIQFSSGTYSASEDEVATITVTRTGDTGNTSTVNYSTSNGIAGSSDYSSTSGMLTFAPGETIKTFTVLITEDSFYEGNETVHISLSGENGAVLGTLSNTVLIITDNDPPPVIQFSSATYSVAEGQIASITVTRTGDTSVTSSVNYASSNGTATAGSDYTSVSGTLTFGPGESTKTFTVTTIGDTLYEIDESVNLALTSPNMAVTGPIATAVLTIIDDDMPPTIQLSSAAYSVVEGGKVTVTVTRTGGASVTSTVNYATGNGTATAGSDYTAVYGTLTFTPGQTSKTFIVTTINDLFFEGDEKLNLILSGAANAILGIPSSAEVTIVDNDSPPAVQLSATSYSVAEGKAVTITVQRTGDTSGTSTAEYSTGNNTAEAGLDYTASSGTLTFNPGQTTATFTVATIDDNAYEGNESFNILLSNSTGATLGTRKSAIVTITDNETAPIIKFISASYSVAEGDTVVINVTRTGAVAGSSTVNYSAKDGTAKAGADYMSGAGTLTFGPEETVKTITVTTLDDLIFEGNETLSVTLSTPIMAKLGTPLTATLTINDNDTPAVIQFSSANYSVSENQNAVVTVRRTGDTSITSTVKFATANGTALSGTDYSAASGTITFAPGETVKTFTVPIINDSIYEADETVNLTLTTPVGATLGTQKTAVLTILDNDGPLLKFSQANYSVNEGSVASVTVSRHGDINKTSTVEYSTSGGTALAGTDYTPASGTLIFTPGELSKTILISTLDDSLAEAGETFTVSLANCIDSTLEGTGALSKATVTILDNDIPPGIIVSLQIDTTGYSPVTIGGTSTVILNGLYKDGSLVDLTAAATWTSSNPNVASVSEGSITGNNAGSTVITTKFGNLSRKFTVVVK